MSNPDWEAEIHQNHPGALALFTETETRKPWYRFPLLEYCRTYNTRGADLFDVYDVGYQQNFDEFYIMVGIATGWTEIMAMYDEMFP